MPKKKTDAEYKEDVRRVHGDSYQPVEPYIDANTPILHMCSAGHFNRVKPYSVLQAKGCRDCSYARRSETQRLPEEIYLSRLSDIGRFSLVSGYTGTNRKATHKCLKCGHIWDVKPNHLLTGRGCPACARREFNYARFRTKDYALNGGVIKVQGFEPFALDLLRRTALSDGDISVGKHVPTIQYRYNGKARLHHPDIYIARRRLIIEVKSTMTFGFGRPSIFYEVCAKRRAALEAGYKYTVWLFNEYGRLLRLPRDWHTLSYDQFIEQFNERNSSRRK